MRNQTAVEWLQIQLKKGIDFNPLEPLSYPKAVDKLFNQAISMEKEQIVNAYKDGKLDGYNYNYKDYYTSTYGK